MPAPPSTAPNAKRMDQELHISSLVVHALPSKVEAVRRAIVQLDGTEIHAVTVEGRMVVTVETSNEADFLKRFAEIDRLTGVVSTALVFHQVEVVVLG